MYLRHSSELMHYGVIGMRWGIHRMNRFNRLADKYKGRVGEVGYRAKANKIQKKLKRTYGEKTVEKISRKERRMQKLRKLLGRTTPYDNTTRRNPDTYSNYPLVEQFHKKRNDSQRWGVVSSR